MNLEEAPSENNKIPDNKIFDLTEYQFQIYIIINRKRLFKCKGNS